MALVLVLLVLPRFAIPSPSLTPCCCLCWGLLLQFIRRSPIFDRLFFKHNDSLRLSNVYELVPGFVTVNKLVQKQTLGLADAEQVGCLATASSV